MYFNTFEYFLFFAIVWCLLRLLPRPGWVLLGTSTACYLVAGWFDSVLIFSLILANWIVLAQTFARPRRIFFHSFWPIGSFPSRTPKCASSSR